MYDLVWSLGPRLPRLTDRKREMAIQVFERIKADILQHLAFRNNHKS